MHCDGCAAKVVQLASTCGFMTVPVDAAGQDSNPWWPISWRRLRCWRRLSPPIGQSSLQVAKSLRDRSYGLRDVGFQIEQVADP